MAKNRKNNRKRKQNKDNEQKKEVWVYEVEEPQEHKSWQFPTVFVGVKAQQISGLLHNNEPSLELIGDLVKTKTKIKANSGKPEEDDNEHEDKDEFMSADKEDQFSIPCEELSEEKESQEIEERRGDSPPTKPPISPNLSPISGFPEQFNDSEFGEPNDVSKWDDFITEKISSTHSPVGSPQRHTEYDSIEGSDEEYKDSNFTPLIRSSDLINFQKTFYGSSSSGSSSDDPKDVSAISYVEPKYERLGSDVSMDSVDESGSGSESNEPQVLEYMIYYYKTDDMERPVGYLNGNIDQQLFHQLIGSEQFVTSDGNIRIHLIHPLDNNILKDVAIVKHSEDLIRIRPKNNSKVNVFGEKSGHFCIKKDSILLIKGILNIFKNGRLNALSGGSHTVESNSGALDLVICDNDQLFLMDNNSDYVIDDESYLEQNIPIPHSFGISPNPEGSPFPFKAKESDPWGELPSCPIRRSVTPRQKSPISESEWDVLPSDPFIPSTPFYTPEERPAFPPQKPYSYAILQPTVPTDPQQPSLQESGFWIREPSKEPSKEPSVRSKIRDPIKEQQLVIDRDSQLPTEEEWLIYLVSEDNTREPVGVFRGELTEDISRLVWIEGGSGWIEAVRIPQNPSDDLYRDTLPVLHARDQTLFTIVPNEEGFSASFSGETGMRYCFTQTGSLFAKGRLRVEFGKSKTYEGRHELRISGFADIFFTNGVVVIQSDRNQIIFDETLPQRYGEIKRTQLSPFSSPTSGGPQSSTPLKRDFWIRDELPERDEEEERDWREDFLPIPQSSSQKRDPLIDSSREESDYWIRDSSPIPLPVVRPEYPNPFDENPFMDRYPPSPIRTPNYGSGFPTVTGSQSLTPLYGRDFIRDSLKRPSVRPKIINPFEAREDRTGELLPQIGSEISPIFGKEFGEKETSFPSYNVYERSSVDYGGDHSEIAQFLVYYRLKLNTYRPIGVLTGNLLGKPLCHEIFDFVQNNGSIEIVLNDIKDCCMKKDIEELRQTPDLICVIIAPNSDAFCSVYGERCGSFVFGSGSQLEIKGKLFYSMDGRLELNTNRTIQLTSSAKLVICNNDIIVIVQI